MACCGCFTKNKTDVFIINESRLQANSLTVERIANMIQIIGGNRYFTIGITKTPYKRIKKHYENNNFKYLYSFGFASCADATYLLDNILTYFWKDYRIIENTNKPKLKSNNNLYHIYVAYKFKINNKIIKK